MNSTYDCKIVSTLGSKMPWAWQKPAVVLRQLSVFPITGVKLSRNSTEVQKI